MRCNVSKRTPFTDPETLIATVQASANLFCPGAYWNHSNTGYVMSGRILERTSQMS